MTHVGDLDFDSPLVVKGSEPSKPTFPPESIIMVTSMGFTEIQAQNALEGKTIKLSRISWIEISPRPTLTNRHTYSSVKTVSIEKSR